MLSSQDIIKKLERLKESYEGEGSMKSMAETINDERFANEIGKLIEEIKTDKL